MYIVVNKESPWPSRLRTTHRWLAFFSIVPMAIWLASGLYLVSNSKLQLIQNYTSNSPIISPTAKLSNIPPHLFPVQSITLTTQLNRLVYQVAGSQTSSVLDAISGETVVVNRHYIERRATELYQGYSTSLTINKIAQLDKMLWQVVFSDSEQTSMLFSTATAKLVGVENKQTRQIELAASLHKMALGTEIPLLLFIAILIATLLILVGWWLLKDSFGEQAGNSNSSTFTRTFHKFFAGLISIQILIWLISAAVMTNNNNNNSSVATPSLIYQQSLVNFSQKLLALPAQQKITITAQPQGAVDKHQQTTSQSMHLMSYASSGNTNWLLMSMAAFAIALVGAGGILLIAQLFGTAARVTKVQSYRVAIFGGSSGGQTLQVTADKSLLSALSEQGMDLPSGCGGNGNCCQCMVKIPNLTSPISVQEQTSLTVSEINQGFRLACQTTVMSDLTIEISDQQSAMAKFEVEVLSSRFLTPFIKELTVKPMLGSPCDFIAGQFINVEIPPFSMTFKPSMIPPPFQLAWQQQRLINTKVSNQLRLERSYSMASSSTVNRSMVFNVGLALPAKGFSVGVGSSYLFGLSRGDKITMSGPLGDFISEENRFKELIFVGAGTGMAPLKSHVDSLLAKGARNKMSLWFGVRTQADIFYQQHFDDLTHRHRNFKWAVSLSQPSQQWEGATGHIQRVLFNEYLNNHSQLNQCQFLLCGPSAMMRDITQLLHRKGVDDSQILKDDFGLA
ncbi:MAG: NADH:ubiquinone reductase (Na(+)-transporting) subunit F [Gammaproteobacteria bacterium]|nr:NADH:ubiquinone reductase (Na(+)-transporting) subunit F [Gammaproteobacteria bacterium]